MNRRGEFHEKIRTKKHRRHRNGADERRRPEWVESRHLRRHARALCPRSSKTLSHARLSTTSRRGIDTFQLRRARPEGWGFEPGPGVGVGDGFFVGPEDLRPENG